MMNSDSKVVTRCVNIIKESLNILLITVLIPLVLTVIYLSFCVKLTVVGPELKMLIFIFGWAFYARIVNTYYDNRWKCKQ